MQLCCLRELFFWCTLRKRILFLFAIFYGIFIIYGMLNFTAARPSKHTPFACRCQSRKPQLLAEPQVFHKLTIEESKRGTPCAMAYSAFFDHRDHAVKVVTDSDLLCFRSVSVSCHLWYNTSESPFPSDLVFDYHLLENEKTEAADRVEQIVGFVELHHLLGAEKFYFYDENVSADVKRVLKSYSQRGLAEVLQWHVKFPSYQIYHDQQVMQLDCSLRNLRQSEWVAQMDIDEALLPTNGLTWSQMVSAYGRGDTGAFIFLNRFFSDDESAVCTNAQSSDQNKFHSNQRVPVYLRRLRYYDEDFLPGTRSKIMYRPEATAQARTHMALLRPGVDLVVLNYNMAANYHYRYAPRVGTTQTRLDQSACRHYALLMSNVHREIQANV